ncbi:MAG: glycogen debranching protein [Firmicutes bacterium]|nr:glycogen debranching protein [Bacillota bacterium]
MRLGISNWNQFEKGIEKEYLLTNGIGGFCSSTIIGANIRKYHGLLNAALDPPVNRCLLLSKIDEEVIINDEEFKLSSNDFVGHREEGFKFLRSYIQDPIPNFTFGIKDITINKEIAMKYGENTVAILYRVETGSDKVEIRFKPYINFRNHHDTSKKESFHYTQEYRNDSLNLIEIERERCLKIYSNCTYIKNEKWSLPMFYENERERGLNSIDFHLIPGEFTIKLEPYKKYEISFVATIEDDIEQRAKEIIENEISRKKALVDKAEYNGELLKDLVIASDQFIVKRESTNTKTIIAGYPWFTDWGRDTMISFTGLTLVTKRYSDAKEILLTFIRYLNKGIIPNMFPDGNTEPLYNTVDGTLWFFQAVYKYLQYTNDYNTVEREIYPHLKEIVKHHMNGTINDIYMDSDGLISAGDESTQLTWMDVKVDDWVVTPRHGKAVEINALWYNSVKIMEILSEKFNDDWMDFGNLADKIRDSFNKTFWNEEKECLFDVIQEEIPIDNIRPNQIFAVSLPFPLLDERKSLQVVNKVYNELYTPYGLRTLDRSNERYIGKYMGDIISRDGAYHQGTVWPWLMGPFIEAYIKANKFSDKSKANARGMLEIFYDHMMDGCLGSISEILDGDEPFKPRGCPAQAWSVAEILRVYHEYIL